MKNLIVTDKYNNKKLMNFLLDNFDGLTTSIFYKTLRKKDIKKWADTCMDFVYKDLGYSKEQVLHATVHMDE